MKAERIAETAARIAARAGGALILISAFLIGADVLARNLGLPLQLHAFELTNFAFAAAVALGFAFAATTRSHIRIDLLYTGLPVGVRAVLDLASVLSLLALAAFMAWQSWRVVAASARLGARPNSTLDVPLALPQAIWALGLTFFATIAAVLAGAALLRLVRGQFAELHGAAGIHAKGPGEEEAR